MMWSISAPIGEAANRRCIRAVGRAAQVGLPGAAKGRATDASGHLDVQCALRRWKRGVFRMATGATSGLMRLNSQCANKAVEIAADVKGVKWVKNDMVVKGQQ